MPTRVQRTIVRDAGPRRYGRRCRRKQALHMQRVNTLSQRTCVARSRRRWAPSSSSHRGQWLRTPRDRSSAATATNLVGGCNGGSHGSKVVSIRVVPVVIAAPDRWLLARRHGVDEQGPGRLAVRVAAQPAPQLGGRLHQGASPRAETHDPCRFGCRPHLGGAQGLGDPFDRGIRPLVIVATLQGHGSRGRRPPAPLGLGLACDGSSAR
jgi:hypothetical protein